jgi:hypothetical protein
MPTPQLSLADLAADCSTSRATGLWANTDSVG